MEILKVYGCGMRRLRGVGLSVMLAIAAFLTPPAFAETVSMVAPLSTVPSVSGWYDPYNSTPSGIASLAGIYYPTGQAACDPLGVGTSILWFVIDPSGTSGQCREINYTYGYIVVRWPMLNQVCPPGYTSNNGPVVQGIANPLSCYNINAPMQCPAPAFRPEVPYTPDGNGKTCSRPDQETYTVTLTPERPATEPSTPLGFTVTVLNQDNQAPKSSVTVHLALKVDPTSGGHAHGDNTRPRGGLNDTTCTSDAPCIDVSTSDADTSKAGFNFKPTDASGTHTITATCAGCSNTATKSIDVKVDGLNPITAKPWLYALIGGEAGKQHHDNHYLTDNAFKQLVILAINYHFLYPNDPILHLNDASLVWGGKFDIQGTWVGDHKGHKKGTVIDIRANSINEMTNSNPGSSIPERLFADFEKLATNTKLNGTGKSAKAKLHCSRGRDPSVDNCVGDINRHYHVILLGVDQ